MSCHCISLSGRVYFAWRQACWQKYNSSSQTEVQKWQHTWNAVEAQLRNPIVRSFHQYLWKKWKSDDETNFAFTTCRNVIGWLFQSWCNTLSLLWNTNSWQRTTASTQHHGGNKVDSDRERFWQKFCSLSESLQYFEFLVCSWFRLVFKSDSQNHNNSDYELLLIPPFGSFHSLVQPQKIFSCNRKQKLRLWLARNLMQYLKPTNIKLDI